MLKISFVRTWLVIVNFCVIVFVWSSGLFVIVFVWSSGLFVIVVVWSFGLYACACDCGHFLSPVWQGL